MTTQPETSASPEDQDARPLSADDQDARPPSADDQDARPPSTDDLDAPPSSTDDRSITAAPGRRWFRYTLPGAWVALAFVCLSFTPSLLPRPAFFEGFVCGVDGAIGYGMGVIGARLGGPGAIDSLECLSWVSFIVDQSRAREAGRALFDAAYERWNDLPAGDRPKLLLFGVSLGSFSGEAAFSGEFDLRNRTDGALFAGPPNFNTLFREFTDGRDAGSPEVQPVFRDGRGAVHRRSELTDRADHGGVGRHQSALSISPVGPDRLVEPRPGAGSPGLAHRTPRRGRAGRHGVDPVRHLLAGHRRHGRAGSGAIGARAQLHQSVRGGTATPVSTWTAGSRWFSHPPGPPRSPRRCGRSSGRSTEPPAVRLRLP